MLCQKKIILAENLSIQNTLLNEIQSKEVHCLINLEDLYEKCVSAGLVPAYVDVLNTTIDSVINTFVIF